jgi:hypothetical protein
MTVFLAVAFGDAANAGQQPDNAAGMNEFSTFRAQPAARCRCVERRWNGSCKLRVCRDRW